MSNGQSVEIVCSACGQESLLMRKPQYDGFKKVGEILSCAACGHIYASEAQVPYKTRHQPKVFTDADRSARVRVFEDGEAARLCRYCEHYVVNPFVQWCYRHKREVEATDSCEDFSPRGENEKKPPI